mgnify:CR=1 FL=1
MEDYTAEMIRDIAFSFCPQCGTAIVPNHKGSWSMNTRLGRKPTPTHNNPPKGTRPEKGLCLVSNMFLNLESITLNKIKVSETGK